MATYIQIMHETQCERPEAPIPQLIFFVGDPPVRVAFSMMKPGIRFIGPDQTDGGQSAEAEYISDKIEGGGKDEYFDSIDTEAPKLLQGKIRIAVANLASVTFTGRTHSTRYAGDKGVTWHEPGPAFTLKLNQQIGVAMLYKASPGLIVQLNLVNE